LRCGSQHPTTARKLDFDWLHFYAATIIPYLQKITTESPDKATYFFEVAPSRCAFPKFRRTRPTVAVKKGISVAPAGFLSLAGRL
jgi:hypothetical protein